MNKEEFVRKLYNKNYIDKIITKVKLIGNNPDYAYDIILTRLFTSILLFSLIILFNKYGYIIGPIGVIIYYYLFSYFSLDRKINKKREILEKEAMHFFEVLTLSLETGKNLTEAINVTTCNVSGLLSDEFKKIIREVEFGKSLSESLNDMQSRIPSEAVNNIILSLNEANLYGSSIINNLYDQISFLREKRKMELKGKISKVPIYISILSVLFFIPLLLLIILGPILLDYLK